jgi:uncharacterized coiled-coil DUF342 family protein
MKTDRKTEKKLEKSIKKLEKRIERLRKDLETNLSSALDIVMTGLSMKPSCKNLDIYNNRIAHISPETGELHNFILYFPEYHELFQIRHYLEAYLTTNCDVLEEDTINEIESLIYKLG